MQPGATHPRRPRLPPCPGFRAARAVTLLLIRAATSAAQPEPPAAAPGDGSPETRAAAPTLRIGRCDELPSAELAEALAARLGRAVAVDGSEAAGGDAWAVELRAGERGATLRLRAPDGAIWVRPVDLPPDAPGTDRVRTVALAVEYLLALAESPFVPAGAVPPEPPTVPPPSAAPAPTGPSAVEPPAVVLAPMPDSSSRVGPERPGGRLDGTLLLGGSSDLSYVTRGRSGALVLGVRVELEWPGGLWLLLEAAWHFAEADYVEPLALHQVPVRFGVGGAVQAGRATFRLALQGVFEAWWSTGGTPRSDWRSGGGPLLSGGYRLLPWLAVGAELGVELVPHGVELLYGETPVFSLGPWRWRGLVWVSFGADLGL
ncbi:MAG: hypothetical protein JXB32_04135 [Deltaproteobacteria bacterium]|nr:hypothetical protein [Deltaproteobacteria bacterium]